MLRRAGLLSGLVDPPDLLEQPAELESASGAAVGVGPRTGAPVRQHGPTQHTSLLEQQPQVERALGGRLRVARLHRYPAGPLGAFDVSGFPQ
jgi:hypothetical protein